MSAKVKTTDVKLDVVKIFAAIAVLAVAIAGFYYFAEESLLIRVGALLASVVIATLIGLQTEQGKAMWGFTQAAQMEVRKVVWPTKQETIQTTGIVILVVVIFAIILWLLDMFLGAVVQSLIGQGG